MSSPSNNSDSSSPSPAREGSPTCTHYNYSSPTTTRSLSSDRWDAHHDAASPSPLCRPTFLNFERNNYHRFAFSPPAARHRRHENDDDCPQTGTISTPRSSDAASASHRSKSRERDFIADVRSFLVHPSLPVSAQEVDSHCSAIEFDLSHCNGQLNSHTELACTLVFALGFKPTSHEIIGHATACRVLTLIDGLAGNNLSAFYNKEILLAVCSALENKNSKTSRAALMLMLVSMLKYDPELMKDIYNEKNVTDEYRALLVASCSMEAISCLFRIHTLVFKHSSSLESFLGIDMNNLFEGIFDLCGFFLKQKTTRQNFCGAFVASATYHVLQPMIDLILSDDSNLCRTVSILCIKFWKDILIPLTQLLASGPGCATLFLRNFCSNEFISSLMKMNDFAQEILGCDGMVLRTLRTVMKFRQQRWLVEARVCCFVATSTEFAITIGDIEELIYSQNLTKELFLEHQFHLIPEYDEDDERLKIFRNCEDPRRCFLGMSELSRRLTPTAAYKDEMRKLVEEDGFEKRFVFGSDHLEIYPFSSSGPTALRKLFVRGEIHHRGSDNRYFEATLFSTAVPQTRHQFVQHTKLSLHHPILCDHSHFVKVVGVSVVEVDDEVTLLPLHERPYCSLQRFLRTCNSGFGIRLSLRGIFNFATQIAECLKILHDNGLFHGSLNLHNCLLFDCGIYEGARDTYRIKLSDCSGLSTWYSFIMPEDAGSFESKDDLIRRTDVLQFGIILEIMLTGKSEFSGPSSLRRKYLDESLIAELADSHAAEEQARGLFRLCKESADYEPTNRPKDGNELVERLKKIQEL